MEWFYPRRRGPEWKQGWTGQSLSSISSPPLPLLVIFGIVTVLLWLSSYTGYKSQLNQTATNLQLLVFLIPILLTFFMLIFATSGNFIFRQREMESDKRSRSGSGSSPWGIGISVVVVLLLLYHQSSLHSTWFGPLWRS